MTTYDNECECTDNGNGGRTRGKNCDILHIPNPQHVPRPKEALPAIGWEEEFRVEIGMNDAHPMAVSTYEAIKEFISTLIASAERKGEVAGLEWVLGLFADTPGSNITWFRKHTSLRTIDDRLAALTHGTGEK